MGYIRRRPTQCNSHRRSSYGGSGTIASSLEKSRWAFYKECEVARYVEELAKLTTSDSSRELHCIR